MIRRWWTSLRDGLARAWRPARLGPRGEALAARHLKRLGYKIVARGARGRLGELDLVAVDGRTVVFVEVKTRQSHDGGHPAEAVDVEKQRRLTRLAVGFLKRHDLLECAARFDVVAVTWPDGRRRPLVEHIRDAFEAIANDGMFS
ncbi:MAG TPA: YraN family protein [Pirellulales bacterium]|nr:YraN family protein [Pirellulales bacterium]